MVKITAEYHGGLHCVATHGPSGDQLNTDAPVDNHGKGEAFSPTDLCATALITCMTTVMGIRAKKMGLDISGLKIEVSKIMSGDLPRRIVELPVEAWIPGKFTDEQKADLKFAADNCPVNCSLHPDIERPLTIHWTNET